MFARLLLISALLAVVSPAFAQANVVVLGLRSVEGDDDLANDLTEQLRAAARSVQGWTVSNAAVSMAQMSLAHGCEDIDAACLNDIAKGLSATEIVYGTLRRTSAREDYDFALSLSLFDAPSGSIVRQIDDTIPRDQASPQALRARADKLMSRLSALKSGGTIEIQANLADADVLVNGEQVGTTRDGALRLEGLQAGSYRIEIRKVGYTPHVSTVSVSEGGETAITAVLSPQGGVEGPAETRGEEHGHKLEWLGWTLIGVSAASLIGTGVSALVVNSVNNNSQYNLYRDAVARGNKMAEAQGMGDQVINDVCKAADQGYMYDLKPSDLSAAQSKCHTAATFQVLQWVFLGTAVATGATGAILVMTANAGAQSDEHPREAKAARPAWALQPSFGPHAAHLSASLRF